MRNEVLFLTLKVFSATGGIEKVCRIVGKAMYESCIRYNKRIKVYSMHDRQDAAADNQYFPTEIFTGFNVLKFRFMRKAIMQGRKSNLVILSHINLLVAGWMIKKLRPSVKVILFAHGIEVWSPVNSFKRKMLQSCDEIISVSDYTRRKIIEVHGVDDAKCTVMNNCLDPFLPLPKNAIAGTRLREKYYIQPHDRVLFTLSRLSAKERYKGYDKVMEAMVQLNASNIKYLIAGSYDKEEKDFIDGLVNKLGLQGRVILAGFIPDDEVAAHFVMSDCYVMPSIKEGFGIVFIEAMYYNLPVIAGNADGSADALQNGALGILVNPGSVDEIRDAIEKVLNNRHQYEPYSKLLQHHFSYDSYKLKINDLFRRTLGWGS